MAAAASWAGLKPVVVTDAYALYCIHQSVAATLSSEDAGAVAQVIDALGKESATVGTAWTLSTEVGPHLHHRAQDQALPTVITSWEKLLSSPGHSVHLLRAGDEAIGFCRTGQKSLFLVVSRPAQC